MIIAVHEDLIRADGQIHGVLCEGTIDYIIEQMNSTPGVYAKAAWALYMSRQHPFFDGNKRTSFIVAAIILKMSGHYLGQQDHDEIYEALHKISDANADCRIEDIERWLKKKSRVWFKAHQRSLLDYL
ncbi:MAG TPA: type II toxin-antitoxin system death-on-curing family toxin [Methanotrichaceae archaeon]|nr:type II toxin-antitoxin system death-on-curing family toxin [Methanotrichaceae archaeon]